MSLPVLIALVALAAAAEPAPQPPEAVEPPAVEAPAEPAVPELPPEPKPEPAPPPPVASIAVSAGVEGDFADLTCGREANEPVFSAVAARLASLPGALKIDSGDLFGTSAPTRILFKRMPNPMVEAIAASGLQALALGRDDFAAPRRAFLSFAGAMEKAGIPYVLSNLTCKPGGATSHPPLCDVVRDAADAPLAFEVAGERIAVLAALSPDALTNAAKDRVEGVVLEPPAEAFAAQTRRARQEGATMVVALYEPERGDPLKDTLELAARLGKDGPDLLLVNRLSRTLSAALASDRQARIVATRNRSVVEYRVGTVVPQEPPRADPAEEVHTLDREATTLLCRELSRAYSGGRLATPLDQQGFTSLVLDVLRDRAEAEVAIINRGAVDADSLFPVRKYLTPLHVNAALPFENRPMVTEMTGAQLRTWATSPGASLFATRGLTVTNGEVKVNGRPISDLLSYDVVTTDFVAEGGHGGLGEGLEFEPFGEQTVRALFSEFLEHDRTQDPREVLPDPAESTRWVFRYSFDGAYTATDIYNPQTRFTDPQLARVPAVTLRVDTEGRADADDPSYTLENGVRLRYATVSTDAPDAPPTGFVENLDLITGRSTLTLRYLRPEKARWYHPLPFVETYVESELSRPETREYHHLELRPTAGVRLDLLENLAVYLGAGASWEVLAKREQMVPPGAPAVPVLSAGWILRPRPIFTIAERVIEGDSTLDLVYRDPFGTGGAQLRANVKISIPIFRALALTLGYDVFGRYAPATSESKQTFGLSGDVLVGLKFTLWKAWQTR